MNRNHCEKCDLKFGPLLSAVNKHKLSTF